MPFVRSWSTGPASYGWERAAAAQWYTIPDPEWSSASPRKPVRHLRRCGRYSNHATEPCGWPPTAGASNGRPPTGASSNGTATIRATEPAFRATGPSALPKNPAARCGSVPTERDSPGSIRRQAGSNASRGTRPIPGPWAEIQSGRCTSTARAVYG
jgi:hypothetical protein